MSALENYAALLHSGYIEPEPPPDEYRAERPAEPDPDGPPPAA